MIKRVFEDMGLQAEKDYIIRSGAISGFTGLRQLLWDYREGFILVLDDNDQILKNENAANMLKAALQLGDRTISYTRARSQTESFNVTKDGIKLTEEDSELSLPADFAGDPPDNYLDRELLRQSDPNASGPIPDSFEFQSKMIFVSNLLKFPAAIKSRCIAIKIDMTVEQTLDLIGSKLDGVFSQFDQVTKEMKEVVFKFILKHAKNLDSIDFRQFQFALVMFMGVIEAGKDPMTDTSWQDWVLILLLDD